MHTPRRTTLKPKLAGAALGTVLLSVALLAHAALRAPLDDRIITVARTGAPTIVEHNVCWKPTENLLKGARVDRYGTSIHERFIVDVLVKRGYLTVRPIDASTLQVVPTAAARSHMSDWWDPQDGVCVRGASVTSTKWWTNYAEVFYPGVTEGRRHLITQVGFSGLPALPGATDPRWGASSLRMEADYTPGGRWSEPVMERPRVWVEDAGIVQR